MKTNRSRSLELAFALSCLMPVAIGAAGTPRGGAPIGGRPLNVTFRDLNNKTYNLRSQSALPAVYLFIGTNCPVANGYTPRILALEKLFHASGLHVFAIYSNSMETRREIAKHASGRGYVFPVVKDDGLLASRLGASMTPEAVLLDESGVIRYRGRFDDNRDAAKVASHDLKDAVAAVLAGKSVKNPVTKAYGCVIMASTPIGAGRLAAVSYSRDIAPILQKNCVSCHRPGEVAPFALQNYQQAATWANAIKDYTARRAMPPWKADSHGEFIDERRLSDKEISLIAKWADTGAPEGDRKLAPPPVKFATGWKLGEPDVVVSMPETYKVDAEGRDEYRCFVIPTNFDTDRYVSALEFHPGNRAVVHHVIAYLDMNGHARKLDTADPGPGYHNPTPGGGPGFFPAPLFGGWAPGNEPRHLPEGVGNLLPKGADIVLEVHYHRDGKPEIDQTKMGVYFSKSPVSKRVRVLPIVNFTFKIPAGAPDFSVPATMPVGQDITVLGVTPHMHVLGKSMKITATLPDRAEKPLVNVPDWDFNWQLTYAYKEPVKLPKGSSVSLVAHYDNSPTNSKNPTKPPKDVTWGEQTTDEMCIAFLAYTADEEDLVHGKTVKDPFDFLETGRKPKTTASNR